ncbi:hypothetical protein LZ495_35085 [Yinghuangia sp. KLBMP8922]|uniref:Secreted protein n=2 Tax=Yinghuangia soli TaxID=2908204 RepID=A0AA41Q6D2_9ACTN|nr:hypothetical protein [Yinghuangia soli]
MSTGAVIAVVLVIVVALIAVAAVLLVMDRSRKLQARFGPEYQRMIGAGENRRAVERELRDRERRHRELHVRPLAPEAHDRFAKEWADVQEAFIDAPQGAVADADDLVVRLMHERGYPTHDYDQRVKDLSVDHGHSLEHYRAAHDVLARAEERQATTEDLRSAMVHYRAIFEELLGRSSNVRPDDSEVRSDKPAPRPNSRQM